MADGRGEMPWAKLASVLIVLSMTALPIVSCEPIEFRGHEILRNEPPEFEELEAAMAALGKRMGGTGDGPDFRMSDRAERDTLFPEDETWMHWLYLALFGLGIVAFFVPSRTRALALLGGAGIAGWILFLERFVPALSGEEDGADALGMFDWDVGAYGALAGFALLLLDGLRPAAAPPD